MKKMYLILALLISFAASAGVWFYGAGEATNLEDVIGFAKNDQKIITGDATDPAATSYVAAIGSLFLRETTPGVWLKTAAANSAWKQVSMGAVEESGKFDADYTLATSWDATGLTNATFGEETTNHLSGAKSYLLTNVTASGNEFIESPDITLPLRSKEKEIAAKFNATYDGDDDDIRCYLYDVTNSAELGAAVNIKASTASKEYAAVGYALSTTATVSVRCEIETVNNGKLLVMDDFVVTDDPFVYAYLTEMTDWEAYTPTGTWTTNTTYTGFKRRVGDSAEYRVRLALAGAPTSAQLKINQPTGEVIDSSKLTHPTSQQSVLGRGIVYLGYTFVSVLYSTTGDVYLVSEKSDGTSLQIDTVTQAVPRTFASGDYIDLEYKVPIVGWSSSSEHVVVPRTAPKQYSEADGDFSVSGWTTVFAKAIYYVDQSGKHRLKGNMNGTTAAGTQANPAISGVTFKDNGASNYQAVSVAGSSTATWYTGRAYNSSSTINLRAGASTTVWIVSFDLELESKPTWAAPVTAQYLAAIPPRVSAKYRTNAGQSISNNTVTTVLFEDLEFDNHSAYNTSTGVFTATKSAVYTVSAQVSYATDVAWENAESASIYLYKNGAVEDEYNLEIQATGGVYMTVALSTSVQLDKGEYITIRTKQNSDSTIALQADGTLNFVNISEL